MSIADDYASIGRAIRERSATSSPPAPEAAAPDEQPYCAWCCNTRVRQIARCTPTGIVQEPCDKCCSK